jgi:methylglyoxal/glyoxal reductase
MHELKQLNSGRRIPSMGLGTWQIESSELIKIIPEAIKIGYRHFDTAHKYENEEGIGVGIIKSGIPREKLFITSKLWITDILQAKKAFEISLHKLQLNYLDLYLIHWPIPFWTKAWIDLENIYRSGKVRSIGVSNFGIKELEIIKKRYDIVPAVNQIEFSPFYYKKELLEYCHSEGIVVSAYSPLTRGLRLDDPKINYLVEKYKKTSSQILLAWCLQHDMVVLPKSTSINHLKENLDSQNTILQPDDMAYLDSLNENYSALTRFWSKQK